MDIEEVLEFADHLIFAMTGKHLDNLQKAILQGAWDNQKYREIAQRHHRSENYVKEVGFKLWRLLSDVLGEELNKANFRAALERRWRFSHLLPVWKAFVKKDSIPIDNLNASELPNSQQLEEEMSVGFEGANVLSPSQVLTPIPRYDLGEAPNVSLFCDRTEQLNTLEKWIVRDRCRLVALLGISGIGKTALAVKLVEQIKDEFDCVIWRSLHSSLSLATLQTNLLQFLSNQQPQFSLTSRCDREMRSLSLDESRSQLIEYLRKYRCLVILDDVQIIFSSGQLAGHYRTGYENYSLLLKQIAELSHNSCFLLLSRDKPKEITELEGANQHCQSFHLNGLETAAAREFLKNQNLAEDEKWEKLIDYYQGHPLWLKQIAALIKDLFGGSVSELFQYDPLFLCEDFLVQLNQQFNRFSESEKQIMSALASKSEPVSIAILLEHIQLMPSDLFNALQSLVRRSAIAKQSQGHLTLFALQPVMKQYVKTLYAGSLK